MKCWNCSSLIVMDDLRVPLEKPIHAQRLTKYFKCPKCDYMYEISVKLFSVPMPAVKSDDPLG